jgi:hypothetical protein
MNANLDAEDLGLLRQSDNLRNTTRGATKSLSSLEHCKVPKAYQKTLQKTFLSRLSRRLTPHLKSQPIPLPSNIVKRDRHAKDVNESPALPASQTRKLKIGSSLQRSQQDLPAIIVDFAPSVMTSELQVETISQ